jgi:two-component system OmpR family response regulator
MRENAGKDEPMNRKKTILVADDDDDFRNGTRLVLEAAGYQVVLAADETEAARAMEEHRPDLTLLDIMMEEVDAGLVLAEKLGPSHPIILLSSIADSADKVFDANRLPVRSILQKPVKPDALLQRVRSVLGE